MAKREEQAPPAAAQPQSADTQNSPSVEAPRREVSFAERKRLQLHAERHVEKRNAETNPQKALRDEPPRRRLESDEEPPENALLDDDETDDEYELAGALDDELPPDDDDNLSDEEITWRKRYEDTKTKLNDVTTAMTQEHAEVMQTQVTLKHEWQDHMTQAKRFAEAYVGGFNQQIAQLEHAFQTGMIEPQNLPAARQQYQSFVNNRNQVLHQIEQMKGVESEAKKREREKQADVARIRLSRSIPGWGREKHRELGEYAQSRGFSLNEFQENLDYRFLEILNDSMELRRADETVRQVRHKRKDTGPKRNAPMQTRGADGRFRQAQKDFRANPNQRGRFADMKLEQLRREKRDR